LAGAQVAVTIVKVACTHGVIVAGLRPVRQARQVEVEHCSSDGRRAGFFTAMVAALWAYDGWNNVAMVSSEIRTGNGICRWR
jgi:APA family basic amino acid/polyamine antiporter